MSAVTRDEEILSVEPGLSHLPIFFVPGPVLCLLIRGPTDSSLCELSESSGCVDGLSWTHLCVPEAFHSGTVGN